MTALTGTRRLVRLALRRDRILLPAWLLSLLGLLALATSTAMDLYADPVERAATAAFKAGSAVSRVFDGPASGDSLGAMTFSEFSTIVTILAAIMSFQAVVRHTRTEEETGRAELVGSAVVGHHARLAAALLVVFGANVVLAAGVTAVLVGSGLPLGGSAVAGAGFAGVGLAFAGVAAVAVQVADSSRAANGAAAGALGVAFLLRAVGDVAGEVTAGGVKVVSSWPSWLSPFGWAQQLRPYHQDNWAVLVLFAILVAVGIAVAVALEDHRDLGAGMIPTRPGSATASPRLTSPIGLAWRLQRGVFAAWAGGITAVAAAFGAVGNGADEFLTSNDQLREAMQTMAGGGSLLDAYFAFMMGFLGVAAAGYTVQAVLRARAEESTGRLESLLAASVGRTRWLASHLLVAGAGTVAVYALAGAAGALGYAAVTGDLSTGVAGLGAAALTQAPAALALGGFAVAAVAWLPRWSVAIAWAALTVSLVIGQLGALLDLPQAVLDLSPFTHLPRVPAEDLTLLPIAVLLAAGAGLVVLALAAFRRRDLTIGG